jgi:hypothetical protein
MKKKVAYQLIKIRVDQFSDAKKGRILELEFKRVDDKAKQFPNKLNMESTAKDAGIFVIDSIHKLNFVYGKFGCFFDDAEFVKGFSISEISFSQAWNKDGSETTFI